MVDSASIVMDLEMEKGMSKADNLRLLTLGIDQLVNPTLVRNLSTKHNHASVPKERDEDIMMTNAHQTQIGNTNYRALFPLVSRINHACDPNAFVMFSQSGLAVGVKAYRKIAPGEEISVSYLPLGMSYSRRQDGLQRWGFTCACSLCSLPTDEKSASDRRRQTIEEAEPKLVELWREQKYQGAIRLAEQVLHLLTEENLISMLPDWYVILARLYLLGGARHEAQEFADAALEILEDLGFLGGEAKEGWTLEKLLASYQDQSIAQV